jgi:hypothetical protein
MEWRPRIEWDSRPHLCWCRSNADLRLHADTGGSRLGPANELKRTVGLAHNSVDVVMTLLAKLDSARACLRYSVETDRDCVESQFNFGINCLQHGVRL